MLALHLREPVGPGRTLYGAGGSRGRYRYTAGWRPVWSCEAHAGELVGPRRAVAAVPGR